MQRDRARPDVLIRPDGRVEPYERPAEAPEEPGPRAEDPAGWVLRRAGSTGQQRYDGRCRPWRPERLDRGGLVDRLE